MTYDEVDLKDGKTCQVVFENTTFIHEGLWSCGLQISSEDFVKTEVFLFVEIAQF